MSVTNISKKRLTNFTKSNPIKLAPAGASLFDGEFCRVSVFVQSCRNSTWGYTLKKDIMDKRNVSKKESEEAADSEVHLSDEEVLLSDIEAELDALDRAHTNGTQLIIEFPVPE